MANVWDRATDFVRAERAALMPIAIGAIFVPLAVQNSLQPIAATGSSAVAAVQGASLVLAIVMLWGQLTIIALTLDPAAGRGAATARASRRLLPVLGVSILILLGLSILMLPMPIALAAGGYDFAAAMRGGAQDIPSGAAAFIGLYAVVLFFAVLWFGARLALVKAVLVAERGSVSAITRSIALTRGLTMKIVGVLALYTVIVLVSYLAVKFVFGTLFEIVAGGDAAVTPATVLTAILCSAVLTVFIVLAATFAAMLYLVASRTRGSIAEPA